MEAQIIISLLTFIIIRSELTGIIKKIRSPKHEILKSEPGDINSYLKKYDFSLDPLEIKFLYYILKNEKNSISTNDFNNLIFLNKMTAINLRQRRHILIKELNIKLFVISNIRESIVRGSSEVDKRKKIYCLSDEAKSNKKLLSLIDSCSKQYIHSPNS